MLQSFWFEFLKIKKLNINFIITKELIEKLS